MNEIKMFEELTAKLLNIEKGGLGEDYDKEIRLKMKEIQKNLVKKRQLLREINKENGENAKQTMQQQTNSQFITPCVMPDDSNRNSSMVGPKAGIKKLSTNYFKRSMMKCIQNFI